MVELKGKAALFILFTSFILYIVDIISDIYVAVNYYRNGEYWWCGTTLAFVILPHIIINSYAAFANISYLLMAPFAAILMWFFQVSIFASFKQEFSRWKREYYRGCGCSKHDESLTLVHAFLRSTEAFAESAPQWCLQNYIMIRQWYFPWYTVVSTVLSLLSLAWSITFLETSRKTTQWNKRGLNDQSFPPWSKVVFLVANLCLLISRLTSIVIFAYVFRFRVLYVVAMHWLLVFIGVCFGSYKGGRHKLLVILDASLRAYVMVFCLIGLVKRSFGKKIRKHFKDFVLLFYGILFLENSAMALLSIYVQSTQPLHITFLAKIVLPLVFGGFTFGVFFLIFYYRCCHPALVMQKTTVEADEKGLPSNTVRKAEKE